MLVLLVSVVPIDRSIKLIKLPQSYSDIVEYNLNITFCFIIEVYYIIILVPTHSITKLRFL